MLKKRVLRGGLAGPALFVVDERERLARSLDALAKQAGTSEKVAE